ncbi:MAG: hypothetical protein V2A54_17455 [Bacteroidota bacterium]
MVCIGASVLMFDCSYYVMSTFPGSRDEMCIAGANLSPLNIVFSMVLSVLVGVLMAGFIALFSRKMANNNVGQKATLSSLSGVGFLLGGFSVICTACTLPVISLFGLTIWLDFFTHFESIFKLVSLAMMVLSLYLLNRQLKNECAVCVVPVKE